MKLLDNFHLFPGTKPSYKYFLIGLSYKKRSLSCKECKVKVELTNVTLNNTSDQFVYLYQIGDSINV